MGQNSRWNPLGNRTFASSETCVESDGNKTEKMSKVWSRNQNNVIYIVATKTRTTSMHVHAII